MMYNYPYYTPFNFRKPSSNSFHNFSKSNQKNSGFFNKKPPTFSTPSTCSSFKDSDINFNKFSNKNFDMNYKKTNKNCNETKNAYTKDKYNSGVNYNESMGNDTFSTDETFNLFGFKLHSDDLLIVAIIFFLYNAGSKDMYLYIALFMLLLS